VQIVAGEVEAHAVAGAERGAGLGFVFAGEFPEVRDVREPHGAAAREDAGGDAVERRVKTRGVERGLVGDARVLRVLEQPDAFALDREFLEAGVAEVALGDGVPLFGVRVASSDSSVHM